jgi:predicted transcriptional regulator
MSPRPTKTPAQKQSEYVRPRIVPGTYIFNHDEDALKARFSKVYRPAGLNFTRAFDVVYGAYWRKYKLISFDEVNLYNVLNYLASKDIGFTSRGMVAELGRGATTIQSQLDRLENVELIHRVCISDVHGQPYYFVMKTPLFEDRDALTDKVRARIKRKGEDLPTVFLTDQLPRLREAVRANHARLRINSPELFPDIAESEHNLNSVIRAFEGDIKAAFEFDRIVADAVSQFPGHEISDDGFQRLCEFKSKAAHLPYTKRQRELANMLRDFYQRFQRGTIAAPTAPAKLDVDEQITMYRQMLADRWTLAQLTEQFAPGMKKEEWAKIARQLK